MAVSWEVLPEYDKYRGGCSQPTIGLSSRVPDGGVEEGTEGAGRVCSPNGASNSVNRPYLHPGTPGKWTTNQRIHIEGLMAPVIYVTEDDLVGYQGRGCDWDVKWKKKRNCHIFNRMTFFFKWKLKTLVCQMRWRERSIGQVTVNSFHWCGEHKEKFKAHYWCHMWDAG